MMRPETTITRCHTQGCRTTVCLDDNPACDCGVVTCAWCPAHECEAVA
jgi:hypothetical protein